MADEVREIEPIEPSTKFCEELQKRILALQPVIWIHTQEENRAVDEIIRAVEKLRTQPLYTHAIQMCFGVWTLTSGLKAWSNPRAIDLTNDVTRQEFLDANPETTMEPERAIEWVEKFQRDIVVVFKDMHQVLRHASPCRRLKDFISTEQSQSQKNMPAKTIIIVSPVIDLPIELDKSVCVVDFALPTEEEITKRLEKILKTVNMSAQVSGKDVPKDKFIISAEEKEEIIRLAKGLTMQEFEDGIALGLIEKKKPDIEIIKQQKKQIVVKNGVLELLDPVPLDEVGGLDRLKDWLSERAAGWSKEGKEYGLSAPRGVLLLGIPGCGKSLVGKAIAHSWNLPAYKLDIGRLFNSTVGSSEAITRNVLKTIEAVSPAVLLIDEIDKGMSGTHSSSQSDSGVTARVFGTILSWLNDHKSDIFLVATSNDVESLPHELLRKGRFDEIFYVDLPATKAREEIFRIHIKKIHRNPDDYNVSKMAKMTGNFSGAEIKAVVDSALIKSFKDNKLKDLHLTQAIQMTVPLWETRKEEIQKLISWIGRDEKKKDGKRAMFASSESFSDDIDSDKNVVSLKAQD